MSELALGGCPHSLPRQPHGKEVDEARHPDGQRQAVDARRPPAEKEGQAAQPLEKPPIFIRKPWGGEGHGAGEGQQRGLQPGAAGLAG